MKSTRHAYVRIGFTWCIWQLMQMLLPSGSEFYLLQWDSVIYFCKSQLPFREKKVKSPSQLSLSKELLTINRFLKLSRPSCNKWRPAIQRLLATCLQHGSADQRDQSDLTDGVDRLIDDVARAISTVGAVIILTLMKTRSQDGTPEAFHRR